MLVTDKSIKLYTFQGSRIFDTLKFLLRAAGIEFTFDNQSSCIEIDKDQGFEWSALKLTAILEDLDMHLENEIDTNPAILNFSKWVNLLPKNMQIELLKNQRYDFEATVNFIHSVRWMY